MCVRVRVSVSVCVCVCVSLCVSPSLRLLLASGMIFAQQVLQLLYGSCSQYSLVGMVLALMCIIVTDLIRVS